MTINLDNTLPALSVASPADGTSFSTSTATVSGALTDALSGVSGVTCDGAAATLSSGNFSCNISLTVGVNLVVVRGTDIAGNVAGSNFHVSLTGSLPAAASLQVTPTGVNMVVGNTQQFTVVDEHGHPRTDATWMVDNASIATIDASSSPTLTAVTVGQATLTATVGSVTAQTQVNILSGTSLPAGTVLWSAPTTSGLSVAQALQAEPRLRGPDLYSIETGGSLLMRALTGDGQQLWTSPFTLPPNTFNAAAVPDGNGGVYLDIGSAGTNRQLVDFDGKTGAQVWKQTLTSDPDGSAVSGNGTIYAAVTKYSASPGKASLIAVDGATGATLSSYDLPLSTVYVISSNSNQSYTLSSASGISNPIVGLDGAAYAAVSVSAKTIDTRPGSSTNFWLTTVVQTLSVLKMLPDGSTVLAPFRVETSDGSPGDLAVIPSSTYLRVRPYGPIIPDGQGGVLVSWYIPGGTSANPTHSYHVTHVSTSGTSDFTFPVFYAGPAIQMVLGDKNQTVYVCDGAVVVAFDISDGSQLWTYTPSSIYDSTNIVASLDGGSLSILNKNGIPPYSQTLLSLDNTGTPISSGTSVAGLPSPWALGNWVGNMDGSFAMFKASPNVLALSSYATPQGNRQLQNAPPKPVLAEFIPFPPCDNTNSACNTADGAGDHIKAGVESVNIPVRQRIFTDNNTTKPDRRPAATGYFLKESATPRDALAIISHSYLIAVPPDPPPYDGISYSAGLDFVDAFLVRKPDPSQTWLAYSSASPDQNGNFLVFVSSVDTNAKVIFIGACDVLHDVIPGLWNISAQTQGRALVVPDLVASNMVNAGFVDLWHATNVWEHIATGLLAGQTLHQAVDAANAWLPGSGLVTPDHPAERWKIIGDANVQLKP